MARKKGTGVNIGSISILVIFVLLCLTTFATLSLVSANADSKLTANAADSLTAYYAADSKAEDILAEISEKCIEPASFEADEEGFYARCLELQTELTADLVTVIKEEELLLFNYSIPVNDKTELQVCVSALFPIKNNGNSYELLKWQTVPTEDWEGDESLNVWQGE